MSAPTNFSESNALLYAQAERWADMHEALDDMTEYELRSLHVAAATLANTIWAVRLNRPGDIPRAYAVPDPREQEEGR